MSSPASRRLLSRYAGTRPAEFARSLARGAAAEAAAVLGELPPAAALPALVRLPPDSARAALAAAPDGVAASWVAAGPPRDGARARRLLAPERRAAVDQLLPAAVRAAVARAGRYPAGSAGALADPDFRRISRDWRVAETAPALRRGAGPILVVDRDDRVLGLFDASRALALGPGTSVGDCVVPVRPLAAGTPAPRAAAPIWEDHGWLPVADPDGRPVGILRRARRLAAAPRTDARRSVVADLAGLQLETAAELVRLAGSR